jgi:hypothetical protein
MYNKTYKGVIMFDIFELLKVKKIIDDNFKEKDFDTALNDTITELRKKRDENLNYCRD